jgi:hypothetical protein
VGSKVYPVVSGTAALPDKDEVIVRVASQKRSFLYIHLVPAVHTGQHVFAGRTVLGRVRFPARHLHLTEIDHGQVINPALHLRPYEDHTTPTVQAVGFYGPEGRAVDPSALQGTVSIVASAFDTPPLPIPGAWADRPVGPSLIRWRLLTSKGNPLTAERTAVDFRATEPPTREFWRKYASGTYQNFPVFDNHYYWGHAGRFLYQLGQLNTDSLPPGAYKISVTASDICGNSATVILPIRLAAHPTQAAVGTDNEALAIPQPPEPS